MISIKPDLIYIASIGGKGLFICQDKKATKIIEGIRNRPERSPFLYKEGIILGQGLRGEINILKGNFKNIGYKPEKLQKNIYPTYSFISRIHQFSNHDFIIQCYWLLYILEKGNSLHQVICQTPKNKRVIFLLLDDRFYTI